MSFERRDLDETVVTRLELSCIDYFDTPHTLSTVDDLSRE